MLSLDVAKAFRITVCVPYGEAGMSVQEARQEAPKKPLATVAADVGHWRR